MSDTPVVQSSPPLVNWRSLYIYTFYRITLLIVLISAYGERSNKIFLGSYNAELYQIVVGCYSVITLTSLLTAYLHWPSWRVQVIFYVICDIFLISAIMHASGGSTTGVGVLLIISVVSGGILMPGKIAFLFAALATIAILLEQIYSEITSVFIYAHYSQAGLLGLSFFATATLAHVLSQKIHSTEALAKQQGSALQKLEKLNTHILQKMQAGIIVVDADEMIQLVNESASHLLGRTLHDQQSLTTASHLLAKQLHLWKNNPNRQPTPFKINKRGINLTIEFSSLTHEKNEFILITLNDAAEMTKKAQQIKLASLGRLTASIAHEIRNPLGAISHAAQLLAESYEIEEGDKRLIEIISEHSKNINTLIKSILQLSKRTPSIPKNILLQEWLHDYVKQNILLQFPQADITIKVRPENICIYFDTLQLTQILSNLCENGLHYSLENTGKSTLLLTASIHPASQQVYLDIIDVGPGILPKHRQYVFEPFFTTRNEGTGLGLYIAKELCEANKAHLEYITTQPTGCCFRITFPIIKQPTLLS